MRQGTLCFKEYKNGTEELYDYSDLHISCKYGFWEWGQTPVQVGTITDASLQTSANYGFITISGDGQNIIADWDETQHVDQEPVIYDVVITVDNMKINKYSKGDPDTTGWYSIDDCQTIDGYEDNPLYFSSGTTNVYDLETQEETKAWSTTEPYFGTGVIADGAYFSSLNNYYIIIDSTNHPGELSFSQSDSWEPDNVLNYSKQTSGTMFYTWRSTDITECTALNHYTWDTSYVNLCYDNTTELTVNGVTYTKQNPGPSYYEIKCSFNYGGSVRPAKTFIRWGTNEPYEEITVNNNPFTFSFTEESVPSGEIGTLVVEFTDANDNGLLLDSFSSQSYRYDTDNFSRYGGTRLLIKSLDYSNIYDYSAGNPIPCNITLENAEPDLTGKYFYNENRPNDGVIYFTSSSVFAMGNCNATVDYGYTMTYDSSTRLWNIVFQRGPDSVTMYYDQNSDVLEMYGYTYVYVSSDPCGSNQYMIYTSVIGQGTITGNDSPYNEGDTATLTAVPASGWTFDHWTDGDNYQEYYDNPLELTMNSDRNIAVRFRNTPPVVTYTVSVNVTGQGTTTGAGGYEEGAQVTLTATPSTGYEFNSWQINGTVVETNSTYQFIMGNQDVTITAVFEEEAEKHIYLCDNSGAHLAEMTNTGSTWNITGSFTSGMYSIRATVTNEYEDAWFKFYQTSGDNRVFVGAGDDASFEDIGTYIVIDDILTSFSLEEDQTTGYYIVNYQNTGAMTVSMVENIVNSYIGELNIPTDTSDLTNGAGFITVSDVSSMSYITMTDVQSLGYIDQTTLSSMSYIDQTSLSSMAYVDNSYLSTYMNSVVGDINAILQTI